LRTFTIKQKLTLITMASSVVALLLVAVAFLAYEYFAFRQTMVRDLYTQAEIIGNQSTAALTYDDQNNAGDILRALSAKKNIVAASLYKQNGDLFASYLVPERNNSQPVPPRAGPVGWRFLDDFLVLFRPIKMNGEVIGTIYLKSDLVELHTRLERYAASFALFTLVSLAVTYLLAMRLQRIISRPISHLAETARTVSAEKNYSIRARKESPDELGQLIDGFNEMLAQIQKRDDALLLARDELEKRVEERTRDLRQQFSRISLLNQIAYAIAARQDFESMVSIVLQQLEEHLPVDYSAAYFLEEPTAMLKVLVRGPKSQTLAEQMQFPPAMSLAQTPFQPCLKDEMIYVSDISRLDLALSQKLAKAGFASVLGSPLVTKDKVFGLMVLMRRQVDGFSEAERDFIHGLSAHMALAIYQAQLYQDLQKAYNELRQSQQTVMQQERLKALGQMASGIAHDINNTLSPILGYVELIRQDEPDLHEDSKAFLHHIKTAGEDIAHIVARLREFYRPRAASETLHALDLNQIIKQCIDMTRPRWRDIPQGRGIMIETSAELDSRLSQFAGIESEIREALVNLLLNAVDAMPAGGAIIVRTRSVKFESAGPNEVPAQVILEVTDTGVGMDEKTRKRCLDPFFSTKGKRGTGLGLAMVYGVMERHDGKIEIDSKPGKGTTMRLIFPVRQLETAAAAKPEPDGPPGPFRILFIDDEVALRELMQKMLGRDGHQVVTPDGGRAGVEAFQAARRRNEPFDVVITDLGMPYMDGREVAAAIKREAPGMPVVMLTGWGAFMKEDNDLPIHVDGLLSKPPSIGDIRAMLRRVVRQPDHRKKAA
jgi:signal transduction histidine kinase/ActR/RegA family two-component response regulator/HAMP domain-containing protein